MRTRRHQQCFAKPPEGWTEAANRGRRRFERRSDGIRASRKPGWARETHAGMKLLRAWVTGKASRPNPRRTRRRPRAPQQQALNGRCSQTPAELTHPSQPSPFRSDQLHSSLHRNASLRSHRIDHDRSTRLELEVPQLHAVYVELESAGLGQFEHDRHDIRPSRRSDGREAADSLRSKELELTLREIHRNPSYRRGRKPPHSGSLVDCTTRMASITTRGVETIGGDTITSPRTPHPPPV